MEFSGIVTLDTGEEICLGDLMVGIGTLSSEQRQFFELVCLQGYTESDAKEELLPNFKSSTLVQQYVDSALCHMIAVYDQVQAGTWRKDGPLPVPEVLPSLPPPEKRRVTVSIPSLHPAVIAGLQRTRTEIVEQIANLQRALSQVDDLLKGVPSEGERSSDVEERPRLRDMAKELARSPL